MRPQHLLHPMFVIHRCLIQSHVLLAQRRFFICACRKTALFIRNSNGLVLQIGDEQNKPVSKTSCKSWRGLFTVLATYARENFMSQEFGQVIPHFFFNAVTAEHGHFLDDAVVHVDQTIPGLVASVDILPPLMAAVRKEELHYPFQPVPLCIKCRRACRFFNIPRLFVR